MKLILKLIFVVFLAGNLQAAEVVDRVVAIVGDDIVTLSDLRRFRSEPSFESKITERSTKDPLEALIRTKLLKQEISKLDLNVTDEEVNSAIRDVIARNRITLDVMREGLAAQGMSFEQYKKELAGQIKQMKFMGQVIFPRIRLTDEEITKKAGAKASDEARLRTRMELLQTRAPAELAKYLEELRSKAYVEIKK